MRHAHAMPFGAQVCAHGGVRFALWAPSARQVDLCLQRPGGEARTRALRRAPHGWFECEESGAAPGDRYRYRIDGDLLVPDPASRFQPEGVHGPSEVIDPGAFDWADANWRGRPWHEAVIYELHVGVFSQQGGFDGVREHLDHLVDTGVSAIELMPVAAFPGARGWGYDGVAPFAPCCVYGRPEALKALVAAAHARGLMVLLDVVYNHFGPEGCYLHAYAPQFFTNRHHTPWGVAINLDGEQAAAVREFFIHNALYWLEEYRLDGLRLDAVHALHDDSAQHLLDALAEAVARGPGARREVHLVLENDRNEAARLACPARPHGRYRAQWNDDLHHALHVLLTGERDGYYEDYALHPLHCLGRCLAEGFAYQGEPSRHRAGRMRGEPSAHLPGGAFVAFLQNHDQIGNRAMGERITALAPPAAVRAATAIVLLAPQAPMLFMGEEFAAAQPFPYFCDFGPDLARAVTAGRRREFARFEHFADEAARAAIPDPNAAATFEAARLDWACLDAPAHRDWLAFVRGLLQLRRRHVVPHLAHASAGACFEIAASGALRVQWPLANGVMLTLLACLAARPARLHELDVPAVAALYAQPDGAERAIAQRRLPPWCVAWYLEHDTRGSRR